MKSSYKHPAQNSQAQFQAWNPVELHIEREVSPAETQKEQLLSIFKPQMDIKAGQPDGRSALYQAGTGEHFSTWQPGEVASEPAKSSPAQWTFFGAFEAPTRKAEQASKFEFEALEEPVGPEDLPEPAEDKALAVLEQARLQAEEIILAAQAEADAILLQAQDEIVEQKKEAYRQGREQAACESQESLKATRALVEEVQAWKSDLTSQGEHILVEMLVEIARKMFGEGVELNPEALQINLNRIMESAQGLGDLKIFLNPRDARLLDPSWSEYQMLVTGERAKVIPSGKITPGGCFIKGNMGNVDGRVETQLNAILKTFEEENESAE